MRAQKEKGTVKIFQLSVAADAGLRGVPGGTVRIVEDGGGEFGAKEARADGVCSDAVSRPGLRHRAGKLADAALGRAIRKPTGKGPGRLQARECHDAAPACFSHSWHEGLA